MLRSFGTWGWRSGCKQYSSHVSYRRHLTISIRQTDEPLRILFCGSEGFSITALEALHKYQQSPDSNILSIDIATKKDQPFGRGFKQLKPPPIKKTATQLNLPLHQFDTFTRWYPPVYEGAAQPCINLIVAVSFGLLVPPRILNGAKFGGLNVHPSMLPDLRGAAPINWSILQGHTHTGVSVQTLHPSKFDHGVILSQTPEPGIAIPRPDHITTDELRQMLAPIGADMLVKAIHDKLYLQPYKTHETSQRSTKTGSEHISAPKILPAMKQLDPFKDNVVTILRKNRAMPKLWAEVQHTTEQGEQTKRINFSTALRAATGEDLQKETTQDVVDNMPIGLPFALVDVKEDILRSENPIYLKVCGGGILAIPNLTVAGGREGPSAAMASRAKFFDQPDIVGPFKVYRFQHQLLPPAQIT